MQQLMPELQPTITGGKEVIDGEPHSIRFTDIAEVCHRLITFSSPQRCSRRRTEAWSFQARRAPCRTCKNSVSRGTQRQPLAKQPAGLRGLMPGGLMLGCSPAGESGGHLDTRAIAGAERPRANIGGPLSRKFQRHRRLPKVPPIDRY